MMEFSFWANEQALGSAALLIIGGIIGVIPYQGFDASLVQFSFFWAAVYSIITGLLIFVLEYPRGRRKKGSVLERRLQAPAARLVTALGPLTRNYYSRFIFYFLLAVPSCCLITTFIGAVGLAIGSLIYLVSALKGEEWRPVSNIQTNASSGTQLKYVPDAPQNPPPRRPGATAANGNGMADSPPVYVVS